MEEEEGDEEEEEEEEEEKEDAGKPKSGQGRGKHIRDVRIIFLSWIDHLLSQWEDCFVFPIVSY